MNEHSASPFDSPWFPRTRGFFVVDAPDISTVQGWLGANDASLGDHTFDEWWASSLLVQAGQPGA